MRAKAQSGRSSFRANQTTSFFLVSGFGSGTYSAKAIERHKASVLTLEPAAPVRDDVLRMLVTGGPPVRGGGGIPAAALAAYCSSSLRMTGKGFATAAFARMLGDL
jgi:hypothetical protein